MGRRRKAKNGKQKQQSRKTSMEDLPIDLYLNILQRLPIFSFWSMKLVCKYFYSLASLPDLILHFHNLHKNPYGLVIRILSSLFSFWHLKEPYYYTVYTNQLYLLDSQRGLTKIVQPSVKKKYNPGPMLSCNGLLCLLFYKKKHTPIGFDYYRACLFNPLTGEHDFLIDPGLPRIRGSSHNGAVVFSSQFFGFGFDVRTEQYKLVRIVRLAYGRDRYGNDRICLQAEVLYLRKNGGQILEIKTPFLCPDQSSDVVVGGAIHWLCEDENSKWFDPKSKVILAFDLFEEKFHQLAKPDFFISEECKISVLGGCLAITDFCSTYNARHEVHIWLLKEYGAKESWTKEFVIRQGFGRLYPLFLLNSGKILMYDEPRAVCCYDPENYWCEGFVNLDKSIVAISHVPSLVSPFL